MRKFYSFLFAALLVVSINGVAYPWGSTGGDGSNYTQLQETAVFFNNSGASLSVGQAVILDTVGSGVSTDTTLGSYVRLTSPQFQSTQRADNILAVGVVKTAVADQRPVVVVTKGAALALIDDSGDAVSSVTAVGTSGSSNGGVGGGTNLGIALEPGSGSDSDSIIIWVDPTGAD